MPADTPSGEPPTAASPSVSAASSSPLSFAEFQKLYREEQRRRFLSGKGSSQPGEPVVPANVVPAHTAAPAAAGAAVPEARRANPDLGWNHPAPPPPPPAAAPPPPRGMMADFATAFRNTVSEVIRLLFPNWDAVLRIVFASVMFTGGVTTQSLFIATALYAAYTLLTHMISSVRVRRVRPDGDGNPDGPTFLGNFFLTHFAAPPPPAPQNNAADSSGADGGGGRPAANPPRLSFLAKTAYVLVKCVETFVWSVYPFYAVEDLEEELLRDGIVYDNTPVRPEDVAPPAEE